MLSRIATFTENGRKKAKEIFSGQNEWNCVYRNGLCTEYKPGGAAGIFLERYMGNKQDREKTIDKK